MPRVVTLRTWGAGCEHHVGVQQTRWQVRVTVVGVLVPHDPWHAVVCAGESDISLDPVARRVDVQRRIKFSLALNAVNPDLLETEVANAVTARRLRSRRAYACRRRNRVRNEDLEVRIPRAAARRDRVTVVGFLPGDPRRRVRTRRGGAPDQRRIVGVTVGVDVERGDRMQGADLLPFVHPLTAVLGRRRLLQEPAGKDLRRAERRARLCPADPRDGPVRSGEIDRRRRRVRRLVDVQ